MPYINNTKRMEIDKYGLDAVQSAGEFNYFITSSMLLYLGDYPNYEAYNKVLGVLTAVKLELYRRMIAPYEQEKCRLNGDVYGKEKD